ncbi:MAG: hypothetical protein AAGB22_13665, partial [Bacteroidota bacterium]
IFGNGCITYSGSNGNFVNTGTDGIFACFSSNVNNCFLDGMGALPISLRHFEAEITAEGVLLSWATAAEWNNDFFTVERSLDGV